jgi:beta-galactosidase
MYSIGNELPEAGSALRGATAREMVAKIRSIDSTRFVTSGPSDK